MKRHAAILNAIFAGAVCVLCSAGTDAADEPKAFRSEARLVLLDVSVRDHQGSFVAGLHKNDFNVDEDGRRQQITVFDRNDLPVTIGILVDESWSMTPKRADVLTAARTFIEQSNRRDEIFILNFNDRVMRGLPAATLFSDNVQQLDSALYRGVPQGKTALYDAVLAGLNQLKLGKCEKKALVLISDGGDTASTHTRHELLAAAENSLATIYTVGVFDPEDTDRDPGILKHLARISGGDCYLPPDASRMVPICKRIAQDIRARYTIGYVPQEGSKSERKIQIHVSAQDRGKLTIRNRTSYRFEEAGDRKK